MGLRTAFFGGGGGGGGGAVSSVFGRTGVVVAALNDYAASLIQNDSSVSGATVKAALNTLLAAIPSVPVASVFGRTGAVVAALNDYAASLIQNDSSVTGATGKAALNELLGPGIVLYTASQVALLTDAGRWVRMNVATGNTYTIPLNATVAFPIGTILTVEQAGAGVTQIVAAVGVAFNKPASFAASLNLAERYASVAIKKVGTDEWTLAGGFILA